MQRSVSQDLQCVAFTISFNRSQAGATLGKAVHDLANIGTSLTCKRKN